jgi:hypothetical protein
MNPFRKQAARRAVRQKRSPILLNVKIRKATTRQRRRKLAWGFASVAAAIAAGCGVLWFSIGRLLDHFFYANPAYTLREVVLDLDGTMDAASARDRAGISEGVNIFSLDLSGAARKLAAHPMAADVKIERRLPGRIEITIVARDPVARIGEGTAGLNPLLVDDTGFSVRPEIWNPEFERLPYIHGAHDHGGGGVVLKDANFQAALDLLREARRCGVAVVAVDTSMGYCLDAEIEGGAKIRFAPDALREQVGRLEKLLAHCNTTGRRLESANLMVRRNTPVKFAMNTPPPESAAAPRDNTTLPN